MDAMCHLFKESDTSAVYVQTMISVRNVKLREITHTLCSKSEDLIRHPLLSYAATNSKTIQIWVTRVTQ
jgi:hypothetical protein